MNDWKAKFPHATEAFWRRNGHLLRADSSTGVRAKKSQRNERGQGEDCGVGADPQSVHYCATIIVRRPRLLDAGDNDRASLKAVRDRIAAALGLPDDKPPGITFDYCQIQSKAKSTTVIIEQKTLAR